MSFRFKCLSSGSCGNCYYIGCGPYGILIDAGLSPRAIKKALEADGVEMKSIMGIFITHDHLDHIKGVGGLSDRFQLPVFCTSKVASGMHPRKPLATVKTIECGQAIQVKDFTIESFAIPHDASENVGYDITINRQHLVIATDVGEITEEVSRHLCQANYLVMEANYDTEMLWNGSYTEELKRRITSGHGHLSNSQTAQFLAEHYTPSLKKIWLCHLSKDNNTPEKAFEAVSDALKAKGIVVGKDLELVAMPRGAATKMYNLEASETWFEQEIPFQY